MNKIVRSTTLVLLLLLLTQFAFAPLTAAFQGTCDAAQFVADVTIPDGTSFKAGDTFDKTWRLKNVGSCTWSTSYNLVFDTGDQMGASASAALSKSVAPGGTIDLTVRMTAPNASGLIRGYWKLKNAGGVLFGIGASANKPFWVEIRVSSSGGGTTGYDFVQNAASAAWSSGAGALTFPGSVTDANGAGLKVDNPKLEDGSNAGAPGLLMAPQNVYNGFVQAQYPAYRVQNGDRFQSVVNCENTATTCYVNFRLDYQVGSGPIKTFWSFNERYEGLYYRADRDLGSLAGQDVKFILRIGAAGYATGDRALWGAPRISSGSVPPTKTPTVTGTPPTPTPTRTPAPTSACDRVTFVSDLDVPDGKVFAPNTNFTKTWRVKNTGTCTWTTSYKLVFVSGEMMGAAANEINLTSTINPNTTVDIPLQLKAPAADGRYRGYWQFKNADGALFGLGSANKPFWVEIVVKAGAATVVPTATGTRLTPTPTPTGPTKTPPPSASGDRATYVLDVSVPDGTVFAPNTNFTKTWRLKNTGTTTWTTDYKLVFANGSQMGGPAELALAANVAPNATVDISVALTSPAANGSYRGHWQLKNAAGKLFGIGSAADKPFWVDIVVKGGAAGGPSATVTVTPTGTVQAATGSYAVVAIPASDGKLNVRSSAGASSPLVGSFTHTTTGIGKIGSGTTVDSAEWWQVKKDNLTGWVNAFYLTEYVAPATFCADAKVTTLLTNLGNALKNNDGAALSALVSPKHGVDIRLVVNNTPVNYTQSTAAGIFTSTESKNWGMAAASGEVVNGSFKDVILPKLNEVYNSAYQLSCNDTSKVGPVGQPWPSEYTTVNFYSIYKPGTPGTELDWRVFLVGAEYVNGQPYLFSLVHFDWVP